MPRCPGSPLLLFSVCVWSREGSEEKGGGGVGRGGEGVHIGLFGRRQKLVLFCAVQPVGGQAGAGAAMRFRVCAARESRDPHAHAHNHTLRTHASQFPSLCLSFLGSPSIREPTAPPPWSCRAQLEVGKGKKKNKEQNRALNPPKTFAASSSLLCFLGSVDQFKRPLLIR